MRTGDLLKFSIVEREGLYFVNVAAYLLDLQNNILRMIAKGQPLYDIAARICAAVEMVLPQATCSIMSVDRAGLLHPLAAPGLPEGFDEGFDGTLFGPAVGSCGSAAYLCAPVSASDIATDPRWEKYRARAVALGFKSCCSIPVAGADGAAIGVIALYRKVYRDLTAEERAGIVACVELCHLALLRHERVADRERRAMVDALTGLPNRAAFNAALASVPCDAPGSWALFQIDLDNLKVVNDTFGHQTGDALIRTAAGRISAAMRPDVAFRLGGDEFAVLIQSPEALWDLDATATRIFQALEMTADCEGHAIVPKATIGGAVYSPGDADGQAVSQNADYALYHAKETGRGGFVRYWPGIGSAMTRRRDAVRDVAVALAEGRIDAFYQPVVRLDTREIVALEALCRLRQQNGTYLSASAFREATSDANVATELTGRMLSIVAADIRAWLDAGLPIQQVGVNISTADFYKGKLAEQLEESFGAAGVSLDHLVLEVTEGVYLGQRDRVVAQEIKALRARGLKVALDDFGTGYASLTHLLTVPVDVIKIDQSFVQGLEPGQPGMAIVRGLIGIARELGVRVVAEGIEANAQARQLWSMGCPFGQGYAFAHAVDRRATTRLLERHSQSVPGARPINLVQNDRDQAEDWSLRPTGSD